MGDPRSIKSASLLILVGALHQWGGVAYAGEVTVGADARAISMPDVVTSILVANPTVRAAASDCHGAAAAAEGEAARYGFVLQLDSSWSNTATPSLVPGFAPGTGFVVNGSQEIFDAGIQLKKHFVLGTDLMLRLDAFRESSTQFFALGSLGPGASMLPGAGPDGTIQTRLGPGYGAALKLTAVQPLLRGAGPTVTLADLRAASVNLTGAELAHERTVSDTLQRGLSAYWEAWYATVAVEIERRSRDTARSQRDVALARVRTGGLAPVDVLAFETQLAGRDESVIHAEAEQRRRAAQLARLLGSADNVEGLTVVPEPPPEPPALAGRLREGALAASPELRELATRVQLAAVQAQTAGEALRPRLDLDGSVQAQGLGYDDAPAAFRQLTTFGAVSAHVGLTFELPLDDTQHRAQKGRALLAVETAEHKLEEARQQILADLETAIEAESSARRLVDLAGKTRQAALQQADAERARFATGGSTALQLLQAEDAVRTAELRRARARADLVEAHITLLHLVGRLIAEVTEKADRADAGRCGARTHRGDSHPLGAPYPD
jgi:outer membrane protein TolC